MSKNCWLMMHFLLDVFVILVDISKKFQEKTATVGDIIYEIESGLKALEKLKTSPGYHMRNGSANEPSALTGNDIAFKSARTKFIEAIIGGLQQRFTDNPGIIQACSVVNLSLFPAKLDEMEAYGETEIQQLVDYFKSPLESAGIAVGKIEVEWNKMVNSIFARFKKPSKATWEEVNMKFLSLYPNILGLIDLILTIPASSADAERGFNRMKITKDNFRSKLLDSRVSDQIVIMLESKNIKVFDPLPAINLWNKTPRRVREKKQVNLPVNTQLNNNQIEGEHPEQNDINEVDDNETDSVGVENEENNNEDYESDKDYEFEQQEEEELEMAKLEYRDRLSEAADAYQRLCKLIDMKDD